MLQPPMLSAVPIATAVTIFFTDILGLYVTLSVILADCDDHVMSAAVGTNSLPLINYS